MKIKMLKSLFVIFFGAVVLWATEPWKEKPYTQWTADECQQVFTDSPWARPVYAPGLQERLAPPTSGFPEDRASQPPRVAFFVRWWSALTLRETLVRQQQLGGSVNEEEATRLLSDTPTDYVIVVSGPQLRVFEDQPEEALRGSSHLELKRSKRTLSPASVQLMKEGARLVAVEFHFPRELNGQPAIPAEEGKAEFSCRVPRTTVSVSFDLRKMVRDGKPDL